MKTKERPAKAKAGKSIKHTKIVVVQQQQKLGNSDPAPPSTFISNKIPYLYPTFCIVTDCWFNKFRRAAIPSVCMPSAKYIALLAN